MLSGSASTPDTWLTFTAILESTETVDCWVIGDKDQEYEVNSTYSYKVKDSDKNENNIIKIGTKRRELKTVTLIFDGTITCKKNIIGTGDEVKSGEVIGEKEWVQFTAVLEDGKVVQNWSLNGKVQASATSKTFSYKVDPNDADENGQIRVEFTQKDAKKITIKFDSNITCTKAGDEISSGTSVQEQDFLKFTANLEEGQIMDHWYLNDKEQEYETSRIFFYTVDSEMANDDGVIKVSFKVK